MKSDHILTQCRRNSKWLKDLNIRDDTIKLLEESIDKPFSDINPTNVSLGQSPKAIEKKKKKTNGIQSNVQDFAQQRKPLKKGQPTKWDKIFANDMTDEGLVFKIYKQLMRFNIIKAFTLVFNSKSLKNEQCPLCLWLSHIKLSYILWD